MQLADEPAVAMTYADDIGYETGRPPCRIGRMGQVPIVSTGRKGALVL
jgi:hypothetical protein